MKRLIKLTNAVGDVVDLSELDNLGFKVQGLGFGLKHDYYTDGVYSIHAKSEQEVEEFSISLLFGIGETKAYAAFQELSIFLNHQPLVMSYQTEGVDEYLRDCRFVKLTKSERIEGMLLEETFSLQFTSPWYQWQEGTLSEYIDQAGDGKIYGLSVYDYVYEDNYADGRYFFVLDNRSRYFGLATSSPLDIVIAAGKQDIQNPSWAIYQHGEVVQSDGYFVTIKPDGMLVVSSNPSGQSAILHALGDEPRNIYQQQDVTKTNFVKAPIGDSLLIFTNCEGATITYRMRQEVVLV